MAIIWKLGQINVAKQLYHGIKLLPRKNSAIPNVIQRLKSEVSIKSRASNFHPPQISPNKKISKAEIKYQNIDKLSSDYSLIYISSITKIIKFCYHSSYIIIISCVFGIFYVHKYAADSDLFSSLTVNDSDKSGVKVHDENEMKIMLGGLILLNCVLFWSTRMHVIRIWFNPQKNLYKLIVTGDMLGFKKSIEFSPGSVILKPKTFIRSLGYVVHHIQGKKYFIIENNFKIPADYRKLLGNTSIH